MAVPSGAVLLIDDRPHRLEGDAIAARPKLRAEVEALRSSPGRLRAELLAGAPKDWSRGAACDDEARLRWARRVAPILGRALGKPDAVVPLAGLWACPDAWRL
ncbi:MAG: hypothetical protein KC731_03555, partial [Myxococcales bacterium]|nr:hypothetical protein [Myxococcales bacterium]